MLNSQQIRHLPIRQDFAVNSFKSLLHVLPQRLPSILKLRWRLTNMSACSEDTLSTDVPARADVVAGRGLCGLAPQVVDQRLGVDVFLDVDRRCVDD